MPTIPITPATLPQWQHSHPLLQQLMAAEELCWLNPSLLPFALAQRQLPLGMVDMQDASDRLQRFAPYIAHTFPSTAAAAGVIESPLRPIPATQAALAAHYQQELPGTLLLKCDNDLPISGSIKARGGIYEVLKVAEQLALQAGLITLNSDYRQLAEPACRALFANHSIQVGSTGNLGLSIGLMGAKLGFAVVVHMSADARQWKKDLLRSQGVRVMEYPGDYGQAVAEGRRLAESDPHCHFVDDENSLDLFLGYSVAALRLQQQLHQQGIRVNAEHPLFVYLPCGVGGGPGGIAFGLKQLFGDHVHCFFAEPTHAPCMLLGLYTGLHHAVAVQNIGLDGCTAADGLAVGRASGFVGKVMEPLLAGVYTCADENLYRLLALLQQHDQIALEPSALAGLPGIARIVRDEQYLRSKGLEGVQHQITHIAWATGGSLVPHDEQQGYYQQGLALLKPA